MQQEICYGIVSGKQSPQRNWAISVKILCHTGELRQEVLKPLTTLKKQNMRNVFEQMKLAENSSVAMQ